MKRAFFLVLLLLEVTAVSGAEAVSDADIMIQIGFITGSQYLEIRDSGKKTFYVMGVLDGIFLAPFFKADKPSLAWLETCLWDMTTTQTAAIVDQHLQGHPQNWHQAMHITVYQAFGNVCPQSPFLGKFN